jgi:signal transduction histidine kinase
VVAPDTRERAPAKDAGARPEDRLLEERTRWAMQIHDGLTQAVTSAVLELQTLRHRIETDPQEAIRALAAVEREIREDLRRIREILFEMTADRPRAVPAFTAFVRELAERWHLTAELDVDADLDRIPEPVLEALHAIVAEALTNAAKHAGVRRARVVVGVAEDALQVCVEDRGRGFAPARDDDAHFGLELMRARAASVGGSVTVESTPGHGTTVRAVLPVGGRGERG